MNNIKSLIKVVTQFNATTWYLYLNSEYIRPHSIMKSN